MAGFKIPKFLKNDPYHPVHCRKFINGTQLDAVPSVPWDHTRHLSPSTHGWEMLVKFPSVTSITRVAATEWLTWHTDYHPVTCHLHARYARREPKNKSSDVSLGEKSKKGRHRWGWQKLIARHWKGKRSSRDIWPLLSDCSSSFCNSSAIKRCQHRKTGCVTKLFFIGCNGRG